MITPMIRQCATHVECKPNKIKLINAESVIHLFQFPDEKETDKTDLFPVNQLTTSHYYPSVLLELPIPYNILHLQVVSRSTKNG